MLSALQLMNLWDDGARQAPLSRALHLLAAVHPEESLESLAALSIGERDSRLLRLRQALWGSQMAAVMTCSSCRERLEVKLDVRDLLAEPRSPPPEAMTIDAAGYRVSFRLPSTSDLLAAAEQSDPEACRSVILQRCLLSAGRQTAVEDGAPLPSEVIETLIERMTEADPMANIELRMVCPSCSHEWRAIFDIVSFLWAEIDAWAPRMASDVHILATAYGWNERAILGMSPARRQIYLDMVRA
jgi:hypothetical protein